MEIEEGISVRVDYLTFTVHDCNEPEFFWDEVFKDKLGSLNNTGHGGIGYKVLYRACEGAQLYCEPINTDRGSYFTIELKGRACECLTPDDFIELVVMRRGGMDIRFRRLDIAFDGLEITPIEFYGELVSGNLNCKASRTSIRIDNSPNQLRDNGEVGGCQTTYIGSKQSNRLVRLYNKHGFNRLELQLRDEWSDAAGCLLFGCPYTEWMKTSISILRDFIDLPDNENWNLLVSCVEPAGIRVYSARLISLDRAKRWLAKQVAPAIFAVQSVEGLDAFLELIVDNVNEKRLERWQSVMQLAGGY